MEEWAESVMEEETDSSASSKNSKNSVMRFGSGSDSDGSGISEKTKSMLE